jgi:hypothetical protein
MAVVADDSHDLLDLGVVHAEQDGGIGLLEEPAGAVQPGRPVLMCEQGVDQDAGIFVVDNGDDELHGAEYRLTAGPDELRI